MASFTGFAARRIALAVALLGLAHSASAQLVVGTSASNGLPAAVHVDVTNGQTTTLWTAAAQKKVYGLAADQSGRKLYSNDAARLSVWNYGSVGTVPTLIAGMYRNNGSTTGDVATGFSGLGWANGRLYGSTSYPSTDFARGIYEISLTPNAANHLIATPVWVEPVNSGVLTLDGIDFDPATNLFYGVQDTDNTGTGGTLTRGVYSIDVFGTGAFTKIAEFPGGNTRIDGLAVGGGKLWLTQQTGASNIVEIFPYDLSTQTYGTTLSFALADSSNRASGATWAPGVVPEPTSVALVAGAAMLLRRRR